jgi:hypothetical protein
MFCSVYSPQESSVYLRRIRTPSELTQLISFRLSEGKRGKRMKKSRFGLILFSVALCALLLFCPTMGYADSMTLTLVSVGGQTSGTNPEVYVYPYNFSFNSSTELTPLMCISYENEIYMGENWQATLVPVTGSGNKQYLEAAYIFSLAAAPGATANTIAVAQWANWELFDKNDPNLTANLPAGYQPQIDIMLTEAATSATTYYPNIDIFIPLSDWPSGDGIPQTFIGDPAEAPEPSSYLLFGTGLLGLAVFGFRKRCAA